jgi:hypothetical protein
MTTQPTAPQLPDLLTHDRSTGAAVIDGVSLRRPGDYYRVVIDLGWPITDAASIEPLVPGATALLAAGRKGAGTPGEEPDDALTSGRLRVRTGRRNLVLRVEDGELRIGKVVDLKGVALRWDGGEARLVARVQGNEWSAEEATFIAARLGRLIAVEVADVQAALPFAKAGEESTLPPEA